MSRTVIDLSKWNGTKNNINWKILKNNIDGVIIRVGLRGFHGDGKLQTDPMFKTYANNCVKYNIPFGVYWFSQEISKLEAIESANYIYNIIKDYKLDYPIYYDIEYSGEPFEGGRADCIGEKTRTDCAVAFCEEIKRLGFVPGVYANEYWFNTKLQFNRLNKYSIWCAKYNNNTGFPETPPSIKFDMWQYTDKGHINGIKLYVDLNKDVSAHITNKIVTETTPNKKQLTDIAQEVIDGKWGNGIDRKKSLESAGYNYDEIQEIVNKILTIGNCDIVRLTGDAIYSNGKTIPNWVKNATLFVRNIRENGDVVISIEQVGPVTGVVNKKYLKKVYMGY